MARLKENLRKKFRVSKATQVGFAVVALLIVAGLGFYLFPILGGGGATSGSTTSCSTNAQSDSSADWTTYHKDNSRSGYAGPITITCVSPSWRSATLDGLVYAEPLAFGGMVFVATENDTVYALNADSGEVVWRTHLGDPVPRSALPCGNINPTGITGTPVIDPASKTIYAVAFEMPGNHFLVALSTEDGSFRFSRTADPVGADPRVEQQRGALSLGNGRIYIPYGGLFGDCGEYHGWVVGISADGSGDLISYQVPTGRAGGIWAPSGAAMDASGDLFVATGNGAPPETFNYGDSVIELSSGLQQLDFFAPSNWMQLDQADTDLGSAGPALLGGGTLFQIGKEGVGYLLNTTDLGGIGGQAYSAKVCSSAYGGTAFAGGLVFVPCTDGLVALRVSGNSFEVAWAGPDFQAGPTIVTGNLVWTMDVSSGTLHGFDADSGHQMFSFSVGSVTRFTTPSSGYGKLFVAAGTQVVSFQLGRA